MDHGIWAIVYELREAQKAEYLAWFHDVHMPEKCSRPGYRWAAHYQLEHGGYLALFGATAAQVFLDPSPGQLAQRQPSGTKRMIGMRQQPYACILMEEHRVEGPDTARRGPGMAPGPVIQLGNYNAASPAVEDDLGAWYVQERLPALGKLPGCVGARKMLATVGACKHAILHEFASLELRERHFGPLEAEGRDPATWMGRIRPQLQHAPWSPAVGVRIKAEG
jgi:hypothetical protein